jgi:hypothetical protein
VVSGVLTVERQAVPGQTLGRSWRCGTCGKVTAVEDRPGFEVVSVWCVRCQSNRGLGKCDEVTSDTTEDPS